MNTRDCYAVLCYGYLIIIEAVLLMHALMYGDGFLIGASGIGLSALALAASYRFPRAPKAAAPKRGPWG